MEFEPEAKPFTEMFTGSGPSRLSPSYALLFLFLNRTHRMLVCLKYRVTSPQVVYDRRHVLYLDINQIVLCDQKTLPDVNVHTLSRSGGASDVEVKLTPLND